MRTFYFMKQFPMFAALALASERLSSVSLGPHNAMTALSPQLIRRSQ